MVTVEQILEIAGISVSFPPPAEAGKKLSPQDEARHYTLVELEEAIKDGYFDIERGQIIFRVKRSCTCTPTLYFGPIKGKAVIALHGTDSENSLQPMVNFIAAWSGEEAHRILDLFEEDFNALLLLAAVYRFRTSGKERPDSDLGQV